MLGFMNKPSVERGTRNEKEETQVIFFVKVKDQIIHVNKCLFIPSYDRFSGNKSTNKEEEGCNFFFNNANS